jgi:hypothetical protein
MLFIEVVFFAKTFFFWKKKKKKELQLLEVCHKEAPLM